MTFDELLALMRSTGLPFAAAGWAEAPQSDYGTVAYRAFDPQFADNKVVYIEREATIVLQSRRGGEASAKLIEDKLHNMDDHITWWLESVDYDETTGLNVWSWGLLL